MTGALTIGDLHAGYARTDVLRGVSLEVPAGEVVTLLGRNGAGKSTLLAAISGFLQPRSGTIALDGQPLATGNPARAAASGVTMVPESRALFTQLSAGDNLAVAGARSDDLDRVLAVFPELEPLLGRRAGLLSGGEQQMLAIARALVRRPRFLLVDEMSMGLSPIVCARLVDALRSTAHAEGIGILLVEQHVHVALEAADHGYVIRRGEITFAGPAEVLRGNLDQVRSAYMAAEPAPMSLVTGGDR